MMPLLDVVFLLLTFFAFALMVMVRADVLDVDLPVVEAGRQAANGPVPIVVSLTADGSYAINGVRVRDVPIEQAIHAARAERPEAPVVLEVDVASQSGQLIELVQMLRQAGIDSFSILGHQEETGPDP